MHSHKRAHQAPQERNTSSQERLGIRGSFFCQEGDAQPMDIPIIYIYIYYMPQHAPVVDR